MSPAAGCPLFVISEVHFDTRMKIFAHSIVGVGEMRTVCCESTFREVRAETAGVRPPRNPFLHHRREVHTAVLACLRSEVLGQTKCMSHLLIVELQETTDSDSSTRCTPTTGTLARTTRLSNANGFSDSNIVPHGDGLKHLLATGTQSCGDGENSRHNDSTRVPLRLPVPIIHVEESPRVSIQEYGALHIQGCLGAPHGIATSPVNFFEALDDARHSIMCGTRECTTQQVENRTFCEVLSLRSLRLPFELLHVLDDSRGRHARMSKKIL
mmetsp:Transcript_11153/g.29699  ORF Transcript_11153/g.29699 Transcript_11153/m.29699 type:complete len:269 (-) Transcript_11153:59-865(-)